MAAPSTSIILGITFSQVTNVFLTFGNRNGSPKFKYTTNQFCFSLWFYLAPDILLQSFENNMQNLCRYATVPLIHAINFQ